MVACFGLQRFLTSYLILSQSCVAEVSTVCTLARRKRVGIWGIGAGRARKIERPAPVLTQFQRDAFLGAPQQYVKLVRVP